MNIAVTTPVVAGQSANCTVTGDNDLGSITLMIKEGGKDPSKARNVADPDANGARDVKALPEGNVIAIAADPAWKAGDRVIFELRDSKRNLVDSLQTIVI
jgi:hypothetical protein